MRSSSWSQDHHRPQGARSWSEDPPGRRAPGLLSRLRQLLVDLAIVGFVIGVGATIGPSLLRPSVTIEPINVPLSLDERGYSGEVVSRRLRDDLRDIYAKARPTILASLKLTDLAAEGRIPDVEAPGGLSLRSVISMIREALDLNDVVVSGELTVDRKPGQAPAKRRNDDDEAQEPPPTYVLKLRSRNAGPFYQTPEPTEDLQSVFRAAAVAILEVTNPVLAGRHYETQRKYDDAARIARKLVESTKPGEAEHGLVLRGNIHVRQQRFDLAIADFEEALKRSPTYALAAVNIAWAQFRAGRYEAAIAAADRAIALDPKAASAYAHKANSLRMLGRAGEAVPVALAAVDLEPANGQPLTALTAAYSVLRRTQDALETGYRAVQRDPNYGSAHLVLAFALQNVGRPQEALLHYRQAAELDPTFLRAWIFYGLALRRAKQLPQALAAFDEALRGEPENGEFLTERGVTLVELRRFADAAPVLERALKTGYKPAVVALALARAEIGLRKPGQALVHFEQAAAADGQSADIWREWAETLTAMKRLADAAAVLGRGREALPKDGLLARASGDAWLAAKDEAKALEAYETAVRLGAMLDAGQQKTVTRLRRKPMVAAKAMP